MRSYEKGIVTVYPGAFFNETVLYAPNGSPTPTKAITAEDSLLLRVTSDKLTEMQHYDPHKAHQLVLAIFKQVLSLPSLDPAGLTHSTPQRANSRAKGHTLPPRGTRCRQGHTLPCDPITAVPRSAPLPIPHLN